MERRTSYRKAIHHDGEIILDGGAKWPCIIEDFCDHGMYLTFSAPVNRAIKAAFSLSGSSEFLLRFLDPQGKYCELYVEVVRDIDSAAGVHFKRAEPEAVAALSRLSTSSPLFQKPQGDLKATLDACIKVCLKHGANLFDRVGPAIHDALKDQALQASTDQDANMYMELGQQFKRKQRTIDEVFLNALAQPLELLERESTPPPNSNDQLSLVDKHEFEDWLTSRVLITKSEALYHAELLPLKLRLDALGLAKAHCKNSIFGPELFVLAYRKSLHSMIPNGKVERLLFKVFETAFMSNLAECYKELNSLLVAKGVLPDLDVKKLLKKNPAPKSSPKEELSEDELCDGQVKGESSRPSQSGSPRIDRAINSGAIAPQNDPLAEFLSQIPVSRSAYGSRGEVEAPRLADDQSLSFQAPPFQSASSHLAGDRKSFERNNQQASAAFGRVQELLKSLKSSNPEQADDSLVQANQEEKYTAQELASSLQSMQAASDQTALNDERRLLERVLGNLDEHLGESKGIDEEQQLAIDVVDRFFVSLKQNPRLSESAVEQLYKLEIPVLKVLLKEENFFSEGSQSVRQVMNRIAQLGSKGSRLNPSQNAKIEALIRKITESFEQDTGVFDEVLDTLDEMVERQSNQYSKNVERVTAAAEGVQRVDQAKAAVVQALNERLAGRAIPKAVQTLIDHGWRDLLNLIHIKHGDNSSEWNEHLSIVDELVRFSENPDSSLDIKTLLPKIQEGLKSVSGIDKPPQVVREDLKKLIQEAPKRNQEMVQPKLEKVLESEDTREARNAEVLKELKPWIKRVRAIAPGTWVQLNKKVSDPQYMRLVWVAQGYSKFVFVNHQGMKVIELGLFKFARYLRDKVIIPDPDYEVPIVNQGLDDMIKNVYDKLAYESSHDDASTLLNYGETCRQIRRVMAEGDREQNCYMACLRVFEQINEEERSPTKFSAGLIGSSLKSLAPERSVIGRVNLNDFVVFSVHDDFDLLSVRLNEQVQLVLQTAAEQEKILRIELAEEQSQLGFNNPETMLGKLSASLGELESQQETSSEAKRVAEPADPDVAEEGPRLSAEQMQALEERHRFSPDFFEIFYQRAQGLSETNAHIVQSELLCSKRNSGFSYAPDIRVEAEALDQWWLERLVLRYQEASPAWDELGQLRVKLSGYTLNSDQFVEQLSQMVEAEALNPNEIWFDIYDASSIDDIHATAERIAALRELGFRFCLDQFGTTRAPFYLMKSLPVQMVKIDEGYVEQLNQDEAETGPTDSVIEVAHYLGREVLASAVDSAICLQRMRKLGVDYAQGSTIADYVLLEDA